jgi:DMSO/TMAO reductase YedYZ heme-binding membrane subunit
MKKRAFEDDEIEQREPSAAPPPARTEPAPYARTAMGLVLLGWLVPLWMLVAIADGTQNEPGTQSLHRVLTVASVTLLLVGMGLAIRGIDRARKDGRIRRRLAVAALLLSLLTPVVWMSELTLAWEMFLARERLEPDAVDASSPSAE